LFIGAPLSNKFDRQYPILIFYEFVAEKSMRAAWSNNLGQLKCDIAAVTDDLGADLDPPFSSGSSAINSGSAVLITAPTDKRRRWTSSTPRRSRAASLASGQRRPLHKDWKSK
jgi:hypothetical protein